MTLTRRERAALLAARRESLVALAQLQRDGLAVHWRAFDTPLRWVERGWQVWQIWHVARAHPWAVLTPAIVVLVFRPRWVGRVAAAFFTISRAGRWLR